MKKCPFCGAVIEENARFCLYCMKELEGKAVLDGKQPFLKKHKIRLIVIGAAALLLIGILLLVSQCSGSEPTDALSGEGSSNAEQAQTEPAESSVSVDAGGISGESSPASGSQSASDVPDDTPSDVPSDALSAEESSEESRRPESSGDRPDPSDAASSDESPEESSQSASSDDRPGTGHTSSAVESSEESDRPTSSSDPGTSEPSGTDERPEESSRPAQGTEEPPRPGAGTEDPGTSDPETPAEQVVYTYRDAKFYDLIDAADRANKDLLAQNAVVITGVETPSKSGVYIIPEQIDGKKVVAVMGGAFSDWEVCSTVKKVVLPASIHSVWETFQYCDELTDLYVSGKSVVVSLYTFSLTANKQRLTVHGAADCVCYYGSVGKTTLQERVTSFGIGFQAWNGGNVF